MYLLYIPSVGDMGVYDYISSESEGEEPYETDDVNTKQMWSAYVHYFLKNSDKRKCGHGKFPYHFAAYLYFRNKSKLGSSYNPTPTTCSMMHECNPNVQLSLRQFYLE